MFKIKVSILFDTLAFLFYLNDSHSFQTLVCSKEGFRDVAVLEVINHKLRSVCKTGSHLSLEEAWNHTGWVKALNESDIDSICHRLELPESDDHVSDLILANFCSPRCGLGFVTLTRVEDAH